MVLFLGTHAFALAKRDRYPAVAVYHVGFQRELLFKPYDTKGRFQPRQARRLEELLRCHHTGRRHALNSRLVGLLYKIARHYPAQRVEVISGYRAPRIARRKGTRHSNHPRGRAADIRVPGISNERLRDYLRTLPRVGVGYYPNSQFVHLDVRDHSAFWIDRSGPGERPSYISEEELHEAATEPRDLALPMPFAL